MNFSMATRMSQAPARRIMPMMAQVKVCQALAIALGSEPERVRRIPERMSMIRAAKAIRAGRGLSKFSITQARPRIVATSLPGPATQSFAQVAMEIL